MSSQLWFQLNWCLCKTLKIHFGGSNWKMKTKDE